MNISQEKLRKLKASADIIEKGDFAVLEKILEYEDFLEDFKEKTSDILVLADKLEEIKQYCISNIETIDSSVKETFNELIGQIDNLSSTIKDNVNKTDFDNLASKLDKKMSDMPNMSDIKSLINTQLNTQIKTVKDTISKIKTDITALELRDKLESIEAENDKLSISAIKNLRKELDELKKEVKNTARGGNIFGLRQLRMVPFSFTGDDSTTTFYLPKEPGAKGYAIWAYYQGQFLQLGTHYTVSGKVFTCTGFTPQTGSYIEGLIII